MEVENLTLFTDDILAKLIGPIAKSGLQGSAARAIE